MKKGNRYGNLICDGCGSYDLELDVFFDGCDWEAEKGDGYKYGVSLNCKCCGRVYIVCRTNDEFAISDIKLSDFGPMNKSIGNL